MGEVNSLNRSACLALLAILMVGAGPPEKSRIPALTSEQQARLDMVVQESNGRDDPFAALVEHLETWPASDEIDLDTEPLRRSVDWGTIGSDPGAKSGELLLLKGTLLQRSDWEISYSKMPVQEWFIQSGSETVIAFVRVDEVQPRIGAGVSVIGRFYTTISATARDGIVRSWPAIVGVPVRVSEDAAVVLPLVLVGVVVIAGAVVLWLRRGAMRSTSTNTAQALAALRQDADEEQVEAELPDDPAEALGVLRHESTSRKGDDA